MTIWWRVVASVTLSLALASGCQGSASEPEATPTTVTTTTTTTTAEERVVYVYQQEVPVDALAASALGSKGLLLPVPSCGEVPQKTLDAIRKVRATSVRRIGGPQAICDDVMRQLREAVEDS